MYSLLLFQNTELDNCVKPAILGVFGDIAMAVRGDFQQYLQVVMMTLHQAAFIPADPVSNYFVLLFRGLVTDGWLAAG